MKVAASEKPAAMPPASARALWIMLAVLFLAHAVAAALPGTWLWGLDALRYLPAWGWLVWGVAGIALAPRIASATTARSRATSRALERPLPLLALAVVAAMVVLLVPDRVQFVGDFLLRQGASEESLPAAWLFPQALPLDLALHVDFPVWAASHLHWAANGTSRLIDAVEAGALAALAVLFARRTAARGAGLAATAAIVWWGGWLALFTGYSKAFTEMVLVLVAAAVSGLDALRGRPRGFALLCATVAAGLAIHRSALALLPALAYVTWIRSRGRAPDSARRSGKKAAAPGWLPLLLPAVGLALVLPKIWRNAGAIDATQFAARGEGALSILTRVLAPTHLLDLLNVALLLVPLAPLALLPSPRGSAPAARDGRELTFLILLGLPFWALALVLRPSQGLARDFDVFAIAGIALALVVAARWARGWQVRPEMARWGAAVAAGSAIPILCFLLLHSDMNRGLDRVRALADGPPLRAPSEVGKMREFLGGRLFRLGRFQDSAVQYGKAVELAPSPNTLAAWGMAARRSGDSATEERAFTTLLARAPKDREAIRVAAFTGLAEIAFDRGDREKARELVMEALRIDPIYPDARALARRLSDARP